MSGPGLPQSTAFHVVKGASGYEIRRDGVLVGEDCDRHSANKAAQELADQARFVGCEIAVYPCFD